MEEKLTFEELYNAYTLCLKHKKKKVGTYNFTNEDLCKNLIKLLDELNNGTYKMKPSNCYIVTDPALREIYAAEFSDRIVQHLYMNEIEKYLENELVDGCCSCRKGKGTDYALGLLKKYLLEVSKNGTKDCYYLKLDLSGYFMSIDRKMLCNKFLKLIENKYIGKHKELLKYLTPIIFAQNPAIDCNNRFSSKLSKSVPDRRKLSKDSKYGIAIGNLTSQAGSNLNLAEFDSFVVNELKLVNYVRYVDDIIIISEDKEKLKAIFNLIIDKLKETNQIINTKKTLIRSAYFGVSFLGKISYPYGYQKPKKTTIIRVYNRANSIISRNINYLLAKVNSQIGMLKRYNCRKLVLNYVSILMSKKMINIYFDLDKFKFCINN